MSQPNSEKDGLWRVSTNPKKESKMRSLYNAQREKIRRKKDFFGVPIRTLTNPSDSFSPPSFMLIVCFSPPVPPWNTLSCPSTIGQAAWSIGTTMTCKTTKTKRVRHLDRRRRIHRLLQTLYRDVQVYFAELRSGFADACKLLSIAQYHRRWSRFNS